MTTPHPENPLTPINAVVVGVGRMGQHHARNYSKIPGYHLVGVVDQKPENAEKAAASFNCKAFSSVDELLNFAHETRTPIHAASVAVPTMFHRATAEKLMA